MFKITLVILLCAILGNGISGQPHDPIETKVSNEPAENVKELQSTHGNLNTSSNNSNSTQQLQTPSKDLPLISSNANATESQVNTVVSNATESQVNTIVSNATAIKKNDPALPNTPVTEKKLINIITDQSTPKGVENDTNQIIKDTTNHIIKTDDKPAHPKPKPPSPNTTTEAPITTTVVPPLPVQPPKPGKWMLNGTNETCIIINMAVQFHVLNATVVNQTTYKIFNLPNNTNETKVSGSCGKLEQSITLHWNSTVNVTNSFTLHFTKNETTKEYSFHHLELNITERNHSTLFIHNGTLYSTGLSSSYRCLKQQNVTLNTNKTNDYLTIYDLQFQAFKADKTTDFGEVKDCKLDTPDIVPIAVGCALAALVIIVLFAYLIGRKRSQSRGYLSM